jgi:hypothetical protein
LVLPATATSPAATIYAAMESAATNGLWSEHEDCMLAATTATTATIATSTTTNVRQLELFYDTVQLQSTTATAAMWISRKCSGYCNIIS